MMVDDESIFERECHSYCYLPERVRGPYVKTLPPGPLIFALIRQWLMMYSMTIIIRFEKVFSILFA